ncbi:transcriptional regulator [Alicyclobacillus sacchari]|nr:DUF1232 domain-containing protein [Alicyclobacillus sacchari]GMA58193.1 transcriptional regulator [Alicyclobacillus sacchari]
MEQKGPNQLEDTVKSLLKQRSMSLRTLSKRTDIDVASISRMLSGKQKANPDYLQRIAVELDVPADELFRAAGFDVGRTKSQDSLDFVRELLNGQEFSKQAIEMELAKYEDYARTDEGANLIVEKFLEKRQQVSGTGAFIEQLDKMYNGFLDSNSDEERCILGSGLLYFVLSTDMIPDYIFPIGYIDDALAIQITWNRFLLIHRTTNE